MYQKHVHKSCLREFFDYEAAIDYNRLHSPWSFKTLPKHQNKPKGHTLSIWVHMYFIICFCSPLVAQCQCLFEWFGFDLVLWFCVPLFPEPGKRGWANIGQHKWDKCNLSCILDAWITTVKSRLRGNKNCLRESTARHQPCWHQHLSFLLDM